MVSVPRLIEPLCQRFLHEGKTRLYVSSLTLIFAGPNRFGTTLV